MNPISSRLCYSYKKEKQATNYEGEEMQMEYQEEAFYQDSEEAVLETSVPVETVDTNEAVIPQPKKKKTRGNRRKFWVHIWHSHNLA